MRAEGSGRLAALVARPWLVAIAATILVAFPVMVLGQASDSDTRSRAKAAQLDSTAYTADAIARTYLDHIQLIQTTLASLALSPRPDKSPFALAVQRGDEVSLQAVADLVRNEYPRYVLRSYIALRGNADTIANPTIAVVSPVDPSLTGRQLSDLSQPIRSALDSILGLPAGNLVEHGLFTALYVSGAQPPSRLLAAVAIPADTGGGCTDACRSTRSPALLFVELDNARIFTDAASPSIGPDDDAYLLNAKHQLLARVRERAPDPRLDLTSDPIIGRIGDGSQIAATGTDPLGRDPRVIVTRHLPNGSTALNIVVSHDASVAEREVDNTLGQLTLFRLLIVFALVVLAGVGALAARHLTMGAVYRERLRLARDLHDLLGHSLSVIALKTQVARGRLASGDATGAITEIAEMESVARESLQDVRGAVDGYRQPTFGSALAGARAALAAAGIESTLENAAGPLPAAVDATFAWILRESVTNVIRHSRAATCSVRLTRRANEALLEVVDDGRSAPAAEPGSGLRGLQERAAARGGHADVGPRPEGGFRVQVAIPV